MSDATLNSDYPGVGRLGFFLSKLGIVVASICSTIYFGPGSAVVRVVSLLVLVAGFILDVMRLRNIGVSQWFALLRLLPYLNLILAIGLLCAQTGWIETRRLDREGIIIASICGALVVIMIVAFLSVRMSSLIPI